MNSIGERLRHFRGPCSQKLFAEQLGVSLGSYRNYERNRRQLRADELVVIDRLGWNVTWLLTGKGTLRHNPSTTEPLQSEREPDSVEGLLREILRELRRQGDTLEVRSNG